MPNPATEKPPPAVGSSIEVAVGAPSELRQELLAHALADYGFRVTAACETAPELIRRLRSAPPRVVLIDEALSGGAGFADVLREARDAAPEAAIVLMVTTVTPAFAHEVTREEIDGVVDGNCGTAQLADALRQVAAGHALFPNGWLRLLRRGEEGSLETLLSGRQFEVLSLVGEGLTNAQIAERLTISENTVKFHLREIYRLIGVDNRVQAARAFGLNAERRTAPLT